MSKSTWLSSPDSSPRALVRQLAARLLDRIVDDRPTGCPHRGFGCTLLHRRAERRQIKRTLVKRHAAHLGGCIAFQALQQVRQVFVTSASASPISKTSSSPSSPSDPDVLDSRVHTRAHIARRFVESGEIEAEIFKVDLFGMVMAFQVCKLARANRRSRRSRSSASPWCRLPASPAWAFPPSAHRPAEFHRRRFHGWCFHGRGKVAAIGASIVGDSLPCSPGAISVFIRPVSSDTGIISAGDLAKIKVEQISCRTLPRAGQVQVDAFTGLIVQREVHAVGAVAIQRRYPGRAVPAPPQTAPRPGRSACP